MIDFKICHTGIYNENNHHCGLFFSCGVVSPDFNCSPPRLTLAAEKQKANAKGISLNGPIPMTRICPDGTPVKRHVLVPLSGALNQK